MDIITSNMSREEYEKTKALYEALYNGFIEEGLKEAWVEAYDRLILAFREFIHDDLAVPFLDSAALYYAYLGNYSDAYIIFKETIYHAKNLGLSWVMGVSEVKLTMLYNLFLRSDSLKENDELIRDMFLRTNSIEPEMEWLSCPYCEHKLSTMTDYFLHLSDHWIPEWTKEDVTEYLISRDISLDPVTEKEKESILNRGAHRQVTRCPVCDAPTPKDAKMCIYCKVEFTD